jgi:hypothetical protein
VTAYRLPVNIIFFAAKGKIVLTDPKRAAIVARETEGIDDDKAKNPNTRSSLGLTENQ